jgi:hypothetical protein
MTQEQGRVLDMLSEGKISADEAERLLAALSAGDSGEPGEVPRERVSVVLETDPDSQTGDVRDDAFTVGESPRVIVNNTNGRVKCTVGPDDTVRVQARLKNPRAVDYKIAQEGDTVRVDVKSKGKPSLLGFLGRGDGADIEITAPRDAEIELSTTNGAIEATGFEGAGAIQSTNGSVGAEGMRGGLDATTVNGRVTLDKCVGDLRANSTNGAIGIADALGSIDAESTNGAITYSGEMTAGGKNRLKASNGSVKIRLQADPSLKIDASSTLGKVSSSLQGVTGSGLLGQKLETTLGDGLAEVVIRTSNGSISIE